MCPDPHNFSEAPPDHQSNMWLPLTYTFSRNESVAALKQGKFGNIRMMAGDSQDGAVSNPWMRAQDAVRGADCSGMANPRDAICPLLHFSATCYYFAEALTTLHETAGKTAPPLGLVSTAVGGSMIEEWVPNTTTDRCKGAALAAHNEQLFNSHVLPFLPMSLKAARA